MGVSVVVDLFHFVCGEVGIYLSGAEGLMSEEFLDDTQIGAIVKHMCGEAVPEGVRADFWVESGLEEVFVEFSTYRACAESVSVLVDEKGLLIELFLTWVGVSEVQV